MEDNVVGTNVFRGRGSPILILVSYFVVNGEVLRLDSLRFTAVSPSGATIAEAKSALLLNHPLAGDEELQLGDLPIEFKGDGSVRGRDPYSTDNRTLYNVVLTFDGVLPEQFDLHLPDVWLEDKKYPSRIFGFKQFQGIGLGLCRT